MQNPSPFEFTLILVALATAACSQRIESTPTAPRASVTEAGASASGSASAPEAPPEAPSLFHTASTSEKPFHVFALTNATFVQTGLFVARLEQDKIVYDASIGKGLGLTGEDLSVVYIERMFGSWPDEAWALRQGSTGRVGYTVALRWEKDRWVGRGGTSPGMVIGDVVKDASGWVGAKYNQMIPGYGLTALSGSRTLPEPRKLSRAEMKACGVNLQTTRIAVHDVVVGPDSSVYALGGLQYCTEEFQALELPTNRFNVVAVDRWKPGAKAWQSLTLPRPKDTGDGYSFGARTTGKDGLFVSYGDKLIFRVNGDVAAPIAMPSDVVGPLRSIVTLSTGEFVVADITGDVFRFAAGGTARKLALPPIGKNRSYAQRIYRLSDDDLIVAASSAQNEEASSVDHALFRTRPTALYEVSQEFAKKSALSSEPPSAYAWGCARPLVLLYEVPNTTPQDFGFDATAKAIASEPSLQPYDFVDFRYGGKRYLGARLTLAIDKSSEYIDHKLRAKPLIKAIEQSVAGSHPSLVCHSPKATRVLKFDASTKKFQATTTS